MYEQINSQLLSLGKNFTDAAVKMQGLSLQGFERIAELQLKSLETNMSATAAFFAQAAEVRDLEGAKAIWPKGMSLAKESAEKLYSTSQEVMGVTLRTNEALGNVIKGSLEATNENVAAQVKKATAAK